MEDVKCNIPIIIYAGLFYNGTAGQLTCFNTTKEFIECADPTGCGIGPDSLAWDYQVWLHALVNFGKISMLLKNFVTDYPCHIRVYMTLYVCGQNNFFDTCHCTMNIFLYCTCSYSTELCSMLWYIVRTCISMHVYAFLCQIENVVENILLYKGLITMGVFDIV